LNSSKEVSADTAEAVNTNPHGHWKVRFLEGNRDASECLPHCFDAVAN